MKSISLTILLTLAAIGTATAASCPAEFHERRLRSSGGGMLFAGPLSIGADLRPDSSSGTQRRYVNLWRLPDAGDVTLVCFYEGLRDAVAIHLAPGPATCRQDQSSFVCAQ